MNEQGQALRRHDGTRTRTKRTAWLGMSLVSAAIAVAGCGTAPVHDHTAQTNGSGSAAGSSKPILAVAAENEYGNVISQIGGKYVSVTSIMTNPNTDPHTYEASTTNAVAIGHAQLVVQNGLGYDAFMNELEAASPSSDRTVIDVANSLGYSPHTKNPHLWYNPTTMPRVAKQIAAALSKDDPAHSAYYKQNLNKFDRSMTALDQAVTAFKHAYAGTPVAVTEPVADYLLQAAGLKIATAWSFQAAVMNGVDPAPHDVQAEENLLSQHRVKAFVYNQQAVDSVTQTLLQIAKKDGVPVVGVYETMPPGHTYQSWMQDELANLRKAIQNGTSTETMS